MVNDNFHPFPRLPLELRDEIWRLCLPYRVYEIDRPINHIIFWTRDPDNITYPCSLTSTSKSNVRPPLLTRVCRESRRVALTRGKWTPMLGWRRGSINRATHRGAGRFVRPRATGTPTRPPCEADWKTGKIIDRGLWEDAARDSAHMNWTPCCDVDFGPSNPEGHPLTTLAEEAKPLIGTPSFMLDAMSDSCQRHPDGAEGSSRLTAPTPNRPLSQREQNLAALKLQPEWLVVMKVIVIHLDLGQAADSGLFGLLGEEPIKVVDAALPLVSRLYELAESCERGASAVTVAQDFTRMSHANMDAMVKREAVKHLQDHEIGKRMRPAIMFRLCTRMCNHIGAPGEGQNV